MGKGDKKSKAGKRFMKSYGNSRRRKPVKVATGASAAPQPATKK